MTPTSDCESVSSPPNFDSVMDFSEHGKLSSDKTSIFYVRFYVCVESDSNLSDVAEESYEIWHTDENFDEMLSGIDQLSPLPVETVQIEPLSSQSRVLSKWILHFLMLMQAKYKLSDLVISSFLKFFSVLLTILGSFSNISADIAKLLPSSLYSAKSLDNQIKYKRYVACRSCHKLYSFQDCIEGSGS